MNILLWVLQVALAWLCIAGGFYQIFKQEQLQKGVAAMRALPRGLWVFLGLVGIAAGLGLILPGATGILPIVTAYAAAVVVVHSLLISGFYLRYGDRAPLPFSATMAVIAAFVVYGRLVLSPL